MKVSMQHAGLFVFLTVVSGSLLNSNVARECYSSFHLGVWTAPYVQHSWFQTAHSSHAGRMSCSFYGWAFSRALDLPPARHGQFDMVNDQTAKACTTRVRPPPPPTWHIRELY